MYSQSPCFHAFCLEITWFPDTNWSARKTNKAGSRGPQPKVARSLHFTRSDLQPTYPCSGTQRKPQKVFQDPPKARGSAWLPLTWKDRSEFPCRASLLPKWLEKPSLRWSLLFAPRLHRRFPMPMPRKGVPKWPRVAQRRKPFASGLQASQRFPFGFLWAPTKAEGRRLEVSKTWESRFVLFGPQSSTQENTRNQKPAGPPFHGLENTNNGFPPHFCRDFLGTHPQKKAPLGGNGRANGRGARGVGWKRLFSPRRKVSSR